MQTVQLSALSGSGQLRGSFGEACTQEQDRGSHVHRDMTLGIRCMRAAAWINTSSSQAPSEPPPPPPPTHPTLLSHHHHLYPSSLPLPLPFPLSPFTHSLPHLLSLPSLSFPALSSLLPPTLPTNQPTQPTLSPTHPPPDVSSQVLLSCSLQGDSRGHHGMPVVWNGSWSRSGVCLCHRS